MNMLFLNVRWKKMQATINEQELWNLWVKEKSERAANELISKYKPLVYYHVERISQSLPKNISKDELRSLGYIGLYDALEKFDPSRDLKFDTYASFRIRGAIIDGLRKEDWLPRKTREKAKKIEATIEKLEQKYLRNVNAEEVASELNIPVEEVYTTINEYFYANILSMDDTINDQDDSEQSFVLKDHREKTPEDHLIEAERIQDLKNVIRELNEKEQLVLSLFYKEELTFTEIGQMLNLSTSRISQIHSKALFKLKSLLEKWM